MDPLCIACVRRLRDICASRGGIAVSGIGDGSLWFELHGRARGPFGEWGYHATLPQCMPTVARIGIVPRRQPAHDSGGERGVTHAAVFFCDTADNAACWNGTIFRFPRPEMWGKDPYGDGQNFWTDRWIPPESLETEVNGEWVPVQPAV